MRSHRTNEGMWLGVIGGVRVEIKVQLGYEIPYCYAAPFLHVITRSPRSFRKVRSDFSSLHGLAFRVGALQRD